MCYQSERARKKEWFRRVFDALTLGDVKMIFFKIKRKVVTLFSPRTMMTHREKKRIPTFLIREEWILPKKPCGRALRRTRQSDPHTNRTRWISDTCVNYIKEPWCLVKKVFLRIHFHIWDTRSAWRVRESKNFPFFFSWTVFCNGKEELFLKKEIEPSSVKRLDVHIIVVFYSDVIDSERSCLKGRKKRILLVVSPVHRRSVMKKIFFPLT